MKADGVWFGALLYADDIVLMAESGEELQKMLNVIENMSRQIEV